MKKALIFTLVCGLIFGTNLYAQHGSGKGNNKTDKEKPDKVKDNKEQANKVTGQGQDKDKGNQGQNKDKENQGKGHAYGKDKDSLQGREFGQNRANEAKSKNDKEAVTNTQTNIDQVSKTNDDTKAKIKEAKDKLEQKKKDKKISEAEYAKKKKELEDMEKQVDDLQKKNNDVKSNLDKQKETQTKTK